jgi:hypothetical protein
VEKLAPEAVKADVQSPGIDFKCQKNILKHKHALGLSHLMTTFEQKTTFANQDVAKPHVTAYEKMIA